MPTTPRTVRSYAGPGRGRRPGREHGGSFSELAAGQLADNVELPEGGGVLLPQGEKDAPQRGRPVCAPPLAGPADVRQIMGLDRGPAASGLGAQRCYQLRQRLVGGDIPAAIPVIGPGVTDVAAFKAPLQPAQLVVGDMLEQLERGPARRK